MFTWFFITYVAFVFFHIRNPPSYFHSDNMLKYLYFILLHFPSYKLFSSLRECIGECIGFFFLHVIFFHVNYLFTCFTFYMTFSCYFFTFGKHFCGFFSTLRKHVIFIKLFLMNYLYLWTY